MPYNFGKITGLKDVLTMIEVKTVDAITTIRINRPEKKNALTLDMYQQMADAINASANDNAIKVILLTGEGDNFTAGNDLADFLKNPDLKEESSVYQFLQAIICCPLPVIAAVKGFAIGIGATLLLHCEQVFADQTASFVYPFINLGLVPEAGSSLLLPRLIGYQKAAHLLLSGEPITAIDAEKVGIVAQLISDKDVFDAAYNYAAKLTQKPRATLIKVKKLMRADQESLQARVEAELIVFAESLNSPEAKEVMTAFIEKRTPNFDNL